MNGPNRSSGLVVSSDLDAVYPTIHEGYAGVGFSAGQFLSIARAYWRLSLAIAAVTLLGTVLLIQVIPKAYTASATLIFDYQNRDPLAGEQMPLGLLQSFIATQTELITSPVVLNQVVDKLNLTADKSFTGGVRGDQNVLRDAAVRVLATKLAVYEGRGGQLLYVNATGRTADAAAAIANEVADTYLDLYRERTSGPATERAKRYTEQLGELRAKVAAAQAKVTDFRAKNGLTEVVSAQSKSDIDVQGLSDLETRLQEAQNERRTAESRATSNVAATDEALTSNAINTLKSQLELKEAEKAKLLNTFGPNHPKILEADAQIEAVRAQLSAELRILAENNSQKVRSARQLEGKYSGAIGAQRQKVLATRELQDEGAKLLVELESAQSVYKRALDGYDQIMFASNSRGANVTLIDRATPPFKPSKPSKVKLLLMGLVGGLLMGLAGPLAYELFWNRRIRHRDDHERDFGLPVLAEFGPIRPSRSSP